LSQSTKIKIVIVDKPLLRFIFASITGR